LNYRQGLSTLCIAWAVAACAQGTTPAATVPAVSDTVRLIVRFARADQVWNAAALKQIRTTLAADVQPLAAVSDSSWVYGVRPRSGQSSEQLLNALRMRSEVVYVEVDGRTRTP
jgi:hypothetical protein